jgi:hypothetical protein
MNMLQLSVGTFIHYGKKRLSRLIDHFEGHFIMMLWHINKYKDLYSTHTLVSYKG